MSGRLHRLWRPTLSGFRSRSIPVRPGAALSIRVHNSDRQVCLTGLTFAALTPPTALFEVILGALTPLGRDFWTQVAPTWAPGPPLALEKRTCFSNVFSYISRISNFCYKVIQKTSK